MYDNLTKDDIKKMSEGKEQRMFPKLHKQSKQNNLILNHMKL